MRSTITGLWEGLSGITKALNKIANAQERVAQAGFEQAAANDRWTDQWGKYWLVVTKEKTDDQ